MKDTSLLLIESCLFSDCNGYWLVAVRPNVNGNGNRVDDAAAKDFGRPFIFLGEVHGIRLIKPHS